MGAQLAPLVSAAVVVALPYLLVQAIASDSVVLGQDLGVVEEREVVLLSVVELEADALPDGRLPEVLWRKHLVGWLRSPVCSTSIGYS